MVVVGVLIAGLTALFAVGLLLAPGGSTEIEFFGLILPNLSARALVMLGLVSGAGFMWGVAVVLGRVATAVRNRRASSASVTTRG